MTSHDRSEENQPDFDPDEAVHQVTAAYERVAGEVHKVIVGQEAVLDELLIALFCGGHTLVVGVPGLAKTLLISTVARALSLQFSRVQFTPDLMPSDMTGTEVIEEDKNTGSRRLRFVKGPIFANVILADEINRTPPKTQAALLEAMQERQVTAGGVRHPLPEPFFVLATQNPIEQEGTYPLPEAQLDRFMFNIKIGYPAEDEEKAIARVSTISGEPEVNKVMAADELMQLQQLVGRVPVPDHVYDYAVAVVRRSRPEEGSVPEYISEWVSWGAGPRATQYLVLGAKARAVLQGRYYASVGDVQAVAHSVMRHRILTNFNAEAEGIDSDSIIDRLLEDTPRVTEE